jgi:hypothetical protein
MVILATCFIYSATAAAAPVAGQGQRGAADRRPRQRVTRFGCGCCLGGHLFPYVPKLPTTLMRVNALEECVMSLRPDFPLDSLKLGDVSPAPPPVLGFCTFAYFMATPWMTLALHASCNSTTLKLARREREKVSPA